MSKPELDIIRSPEAETFLRSVTKGFYDRSSTGLWLFEVIGREWDELRRWSDGMQTELHPQTCSWSIAVWEWVYGIQADVNLTLQERRQRILSKIIGQRPVNPEVIRRGLEALTGVKTKVFDPVGPYTFQIILCPDAGTTPDIAIQDDRIMRYVQSVKPAHLRACIRIEIRRVFRYTIPFVCGISAQTQARMLDLPGGHQTVRNRMEIKQATNVTTSLANSTGRLFYRTHIKQKRIE